MVDGILKTRKKKKKRKQVRHAMWNEENLQHNEENKSATMKIDEPDTPYVKYDLDAYADDGADDDDGQNDHVNTNLGSPENEVFMLDANNNNNNNNSSTNSSVDFNFTSSSDKDNQRKSQLRTIQLNASNTNQQHRSPTATSPERFSFERKLLDPHSPTFQRFDLASAMSEIHDKLDEDSTSTTFETIEAKKKRKFKEQRRLHYNEFKKKKQMQAEEQEDRKSVV